MKFCAPLSFYGLSTQPKITLKAAVSLPPVRVITWAERRKARGGGKVYFYLWSYLLMVFTVAPPRMCT